MVLLQAAYVWTHRNLSAVLRVGKIVMNKNIILYFIIGVAIPISFDLRIGT